MRLPRSAPHHRVPAAMAGARSTARHIFADRPAAAASAGRSPPATDRHLHRTTIAFTRGGEASGFIAAGVGRVCTSDRWGAVALAQSG